MGKILNAFADDELSVNPTIYKGCPEYEKGVDRMYRIAEALDAKLNDEERELFEQYRDTQSDENHLYQLDVFNRGFRVAVLMLFEVFAAGKDEFILSKRVNELKHSYNSFAVVIYTSEKTVVRTFGTGS